MNPVDPLAQLRDIHLPEPINWWPPAPGWWLIFFIGLAALLWIILSLVKYWQKNRYRRAALRELRLLSNSDQVDQKVVLEKISILLRRVAVHTYGREKVAQLSGNKWLAFLDTTGKTDQFSRGAANVLGYGVYQSSVEADVPKVRQAVEQWIKGHRR